MIQSYIITIKFIIIIKYHEFCKKHLEKFILIKTSSLKLIKIKTIKDTIKKYIKPVIIINSRWDSRLTIQSVIIISKVLKKYYKWSN